MEAEGRILLEAINKKSIQSRLNAILNNAVLMNPKSAEASAEARKKGNDLLLKRKRHDAETHKAVFSHYCESIALAPMESQELALAYGNRSYLLLHMHKYEECIQDIDRALAFLIPDVLKAKLLCRKAECRKRLGSPSISSILKIAETVAENIVGQDKIKVLKMIGTVKALDVDTKKEGLSSRDQKSKADYDLAITDDYSRRVSIEYSEKYGRQVIAAKDYKPGDIIFVEKMYAAAFVDGSSLLACDYCQKHVWSSIPCSHCKWAMYCSENCKKEAWNEYHDVECSIISHLKQWAIFAWKPAVLPLRIFIMGIKETGGFENFKKEIELLNQRTDDSSRHFFKNGQFGMKSIRNICYLASSLNPHNSFVDFAIVVLCILISLTKYSKLKDDFNLKQIEDIEMNEDMMFLGSFLIKIMGVLNVNAFRAHHDDALRFTSEFQNKKSMIEHYEGKRCLGILYSLLNHSCFPLAEWCCTDTNKIIVYALQPIKKHSQIFVRYCYGFETESQSVRQAKFIRKYNFTCECRACVENWRPIKMTGYIDEYKKEEDVVKDIKTGKFSYEDLQEVVKVLKERRQVDKLHIKKMSALITQAMHWRQPSHMFYDLTGFFRQLFKSIYSTEPLIFNECF